MSLKQILKLMLKKIIDPFYAGGAAEVAFFLLLSIVPTVILLAQIFNLFTMSITALEDVVTRYANNDFLDILLPLLQYKPSNTVTVALVILATWSGSRALFSLMRISNYAYKGGSGYRNPLLGYIRERLRALVTIVLVLLTLAFALNVLVFGELIVRVVLKYLNSFFDQDFTFSQVWYTVRWVIAFGLYFFMVLSIYYLLPNRESTFSRLIGKTLGATLKNFFTSWARRSRQVLRMIFPGSVFASITMLLSTWLYALYVRYLASRANFNILYGGLSSVVLLLLWFYVIAFILIIGIQLNAAWAEARKESPRVPRKKRKEKRDDQ